MAQPLEKAAKEIDEAIQKALSGKALELLSRSVVKPMPRELKVVFASLCLRVGKPDWGLRLLNPVVRPERRLPVKASESEELQYAACLIKCGAAEEGLELLSSLNAERYPEVLLYQTFGLASQWEYGQTIPLLERYLASTSISDYQRLVGRVNLAAALINERRHLEAETQLALLREKSEAEGRWLLLGNSLELSAANQVIQHQFDSAERFLTRADELLREVSAIDSFFPRKWRAISSFLQHPKGGHLQALRAEAAALNHWETLRDCDRFEAIATRNTSLFLRLYFGTPFEAFRRRLKTEFPEPAIIPGSYALQLGDGAGDPVNILSGQDALKPGQNLFRMMRTLCADSYRPVRLAALHHRVFPGEFYNPVSSPKRVHRLLGRLRDWIEEREIPIEILSENNHYRIRALRPLIIALPGEAIFSDKSTLLLSALRAHISGRAFTTIEARQLWKGSVRSAQRTLEQGVKSGRLRRVGSGSKATYEFVD